MAALLAGLAGCEDTGGEERSQRTQGKPKEGKPADGTFVGRLRGTSAFVAVAAAPVVEGQRRREVSVFVCDGEDVCEWLAVSTAGNRFSAESTDGDASASGTLTRRTAKGSIELGGETIEYTARRASAATGLYTLQIRPSGRLQGASAGGVGLTGHSTLPDPGRGALKLADGTRLRFRATRGAGAKALGIGRGEARLIVLSGGQLRGAGSSFYLRSSR
jgi:hypothetical protein